MVGTVTTLPTHPERQTEPPLFSSTVEATTTPSIYLSIYLFINLSIYLYIKMVGTVTTYPSWTADCDGVPHLYLPSMYLSIYLLIYLSIYQDGGYSDNLPILNGQTVTVSPFSIYHLSIYISINLSIYLSRWWVQWQPTHPERADGDGVPLLWELGHLSPGWHGLENVSGTEKKFAHFERNPK